MVTLTAAVDDDAVVVPVAALVAGVEVWVELKAADAWL
jgi:hypothetical protein